MLLNGMGFFLPHNKTEKTLCGSNRDSNQAAQPRISVQELGGILVPNQTTLSFFFCS